jgi:hypothetical protein
LGETAATEGGMRRGQASPAAKSLENQGLETQGEKLPDPSIIYSSHLIPQSFFYLHKGTLKCGLVANKK